MSARVEPNVVLHVFADIPFEASADDLLRAMKIRKVSASLTRLAEDLVQRSHGIARPKALCRVAYIDESSDTTVRIAGHSFTSRVPRQNLDGVQRVFPFVATCGAEMDALLQDKADIMASFCLDTLMMLAVQAARRHLERFLKQTYAVPQLSRMAPGSLQDWPIQEQGPLFELLGDVEGLIGVRLTERFLMTPIKSVSGIFFPTEVRFESCQLCARPNCPGRRTQYDPASAAKYGVSPAHDA
jgi:hypothetical protein